jgi:PAS domain S-box-containing protein
MRKSWARVQKFMSANTSKKDLFGAIVDKHYPLIIDELEKAIFFTDKNGNIIFVSDEVANVFSITKEKIFEFKNISNLWKAAWITTGKSDRVPFEKTPFHQALQTGEMHAETFVLLFENGKTRYVRFESLPLFEKDESVPFAVVTSVADLAKRKTISQESRAKDTLFSVFINQTPNLLWMVDEDAHLIFANPSFLHYFGLSEKDLDKKLTELVPVAVADSLYEDHLQVLETGEALKKEQKVKWADGSNLSFLIHIFPISGLGDKKMLGGHAVPLADKYAIEKQLREANEKLLNLSRAASNAIWEWDMRTGQIFRNEPLLDMIGYPIENTKGLAWWLHRIHPGDRDRVSDKVKNTAERKQLSWEESYRFKCADGSYKYIRDRGFVIYENDLPVKMVGSLQDVTDLKELEGRLIEEKIRRQKEIAETVIQVQEKERTRIGQELHDNVNQVLTSAKLFLELLNPVTKEEKEIKNKSSEYIAQAIDEIRTLSRELVVPQLKGRTLVESIKTLIDDVHIANAMKIGFSHDHENDLLTPGKKLTLFRIIQEQLKNILKYSKASEVDIYLHCRNGEVELLIKDNGIGFDPKKTYRGVGLSSIHERTRFYNGTANIQTAAGKGCLLTVTIPVED